MTTPGWSWLWMLLVAALALRVPRRKHDRWGPYRFVANRGALQPTQSAAPVFRCHNPRSRVSAAVGIAPTGMALLVLSTLATSACGGPHHGPHHTVPPPRRPPHTFAIRVVACVLPSPPSPHSPPTSRSPRRSTYPNPDPDHSVQRKGRLEECGQ